MKFKKDGNERVNKSIIAGTVVEDPRNKVTHGGSAILEFPVMTREEYMDKSGNHKTREIRHNAVAYGKLAEAFSQRIRKGMYVLVEGSLQNEFIDRPGVGKGFRSEIIAKTIEIPVTSAPA